VLHKLAKAYLDKGDPDGGRRTIDRILELDPTALKWNVEVAGLEGRYWKDDGGRKEKADRPEQARESFRKARDAYQAAMEIEGDRADYYAADNVGQLSLKLGDVEAAKRAYTRAKAALEGITPENENVWTLATRATTAMVLGSEEEAVGYLKQLRALAPSESEKKSVRRGLESLREPLGKGDADLERWIAALNG
jgi:tetratricopeptide (TPR) repeat protein